MLFLVDFSKRAVSFVLGEIFDGRSYFYAGYIFLFRSRYFKGVVVMVGLAIMVLFWLIDLWFVVRAIATTPIIMIKIIKLSFVSFMGYSTSSITYS